MGGISAPGSSFASSEAYSSNSFKAPVMGAFDMDGSLCYWASCPAETALTHPQIRVASSPVLPQTCLSNTWGWQALGMALAVVLHLLPAAGWLGRL